MRKCKLGDILQFHRGYDLPISEMEKGDYPVVGSSGINGYHSSYTTEAPSVSVGRSGNSAGKAFIYYGKTWTHNTALFVSKFKNCNPVYAYYLLKSINLSDYATGSAVPTLNRNHIHDIDIQIPDTIQEQNKIANILKAIDDKIEINENKIDILESMAKTLYDYWFVQFDFPDADGRPYKTSGGKMVWNEELGREIPAGWDVKHLRDFVEMKTEIENPQVSPQKMYEHYSIPAYDTDKYPIMEKGEAINSSKYKVNRGDILYSKLNPKFKRIWSPFCFSENAICSTEFLVFRTINHINHDYIYAVMNDDSFQTFMIQQSSSSTGSRKRVQPENCLRYAFAVPESYLIEQYTRKYNNILKLIKNCIEENHKLASLRDFLLPQLMNGQVKFRS